MDLTFDQFKLDQFKFDQGWVAPIAIVLGVVVALMILFVILRAVFGAVGWVFRKLFRRREPLIADRLSEHLEALRPARTLGDRFDRLFERVVGRSVLAWSGAQAAATLLFVGVAAGAGAWLWRDRVELSAGVGVAAMLFLLAIYWFMHWRWLRQVQEALPDTFHLMARSLRAGLTVDQSVALIGDQGQKPLAAEFKRCAEHLRLGMTVPAAFQLTADRIGLVDFALLVTLVTLHRQTGGNLALLVDRLAATIRSRNQFRGQVLATTALGRLSGIFIAVAAPAFMVFYWLVYPDYIARLTETQMGVNALSIAAVLEVIGVVWLLWLLRVDY